MNVMLKWFRVVWAVLRTPVFQLVDLFMFWWLRRRGYRPVEEFALDAGYASLQGLHEYVDKSGHLNTVSGRRPRAIRRLTEGLVHAYQLLQPAQVILGPGALSPSQLKRRIAKQRAAAQGVL